MTRVGLVAAPVAALTWLEAEHTLLPAGLALVYDLGPDSHDLTIVAIGAANDDTDPIIGRPLRATGFGEHINEPGQVPDGARAPDDLISDCLRAAGLDASALDVVLVTGAPAPLGLTECIERLGIAVITPAHAGTVAAQGAALLAAASRVPTPVPAGEGTRPRGRPRHLRVVVTVAVAAAALTVPWFLHTIPADDNPAAPFRQSTAHGVRLVEKPGPPHFPSASVTATPVAAAESTLTTVDLHPIDPTPHLVAVAAPPAPVDPTVDFATEPDTTIAPTTTKAPPVKFVPVTFTVPTTEPVPTQTPPPDTSVPPTEPTQPSTPPTPEEDPEDTTPTEPTTPSQSDTPIPATP